MDEEIRSRIHHLHEVEHLSLTQIGSLLGISRKKVTRILRGSQGPGQPKCESVISPYERLVQQWYSEYPCLKAIQVLDRLRSYGFTGGYTSVKEYTRPLRKKRKVVFYHELTFLPGEEAQVDWMQRRFPFGIAYGFVYILAYSRYLYAHFYPRATMEFFLDGHLQAFREIGGIPRNHRYDNLKSVILQRKPEITFNGQFLDFARHYGFTPRPCTPGRANEKGRVERVIRDIGAFLNVQNFSDLVDLNRHLGLWRRERNSRLHRSTGRPPAESLKEEKLQPLPRIAYPPYRQLTASISKTGFVTFDHNRYSVPSPYSDQPCLIRAFPEHLEIMIEQKTIARHARLFTQGQTTEHPIHRERLLAVTPHYKYQRIERLMRSIDPAIDQFLQQADKEGQDVLQIAYELFKLLKGVAKATLVSAIRTALEIHVHKASYIQSLLRPGVSPAHPVHPQDSALLQITYEGRSLDEYDDLL
ncbi:MAG TPA: IS21 family transposase [Thermodesulfobacteriota bacterium]|nr:IS21 family transposase [Thermodesulfobacteriota bacterium]